MKLNSARPIMFLLLVPLFWRCSSFPPSSSKTWAEKEKEKARGSIRIVSVSAEKPGDWTSLEKEINTVLPLLFSKEALIVVSRENEADYSADVTVREREYINGWQTKRSLSAEVRIWDGDNSEPLPLAAGRYLIQGKQSIASSKTLVFMLKKAVKNATKGLPKKNNLDPSGAK
jgi:hypothetical protein